MPDAGWDYNPAGVYPKPGGGEEYGQDRALEEVARNKLGRSHPLLARALSGVNTSAMLDKVTGFFNFAITDRTEKQIALVIAEVSRKTADILVNYGIPERKRDFALDHDYVIHIHDSHGLDKERGRGQEPIKPQDLADLAVIVESELAIFSQASPPISRNGARRVVVDVAYAGFVYRIVLEVRKHHIVPYTMFKRRK